MAYGVIILIVMVWWPGGILGDKEIDGAWERILGWLRKAPADVPVVATQGAAARQRWPRPRAPVSPPAVGYKRRGGRCGPR